MAVRLNLQAIGSEGIPCPYCLHVLPPFAEIAASFFVEGPRPCKNCGKSVDLWEAALRIARQPSSSFLALTSLGANRTLFLFDLRRGETKELDLTAYGVPDGATILQLHFTPQGGDCLAQLVHANQASPRFIGHKIQVYGLPIDVGAAGTKTCAGVTWIRESAGADSWLYLVDAFEAIAARKYWHAILPAHVAFEITLVPEVELWIEAYISRARIKEFADEALTVSVALNVVLPLLCEITHAPRLPAEIVGQLNRLRKLRNDLVHEGLKRDSVSEQLAVEMLVASIFGFEYVRFLRTFIMLKGTEK